MKLPAFCYALLALPVLAFAEEAPAPGPLRTATTAEMYVSCFLFVHDAPVPNVLARPPAYSGETCGLASIAAIMRYEGQGGALPNARFCLPNTGAERADPARAMAYTFIEYFETHANIAALRGFVGYVVAMRERYPCP
jgi:hypothetical protein